MALSIFSFFTPRANAPSSQYPTGSFKNRTAPGLFDGTPLLADDRNDQQGFTDALLAFAGISPSGIPDTALNSDRMKSLMKILSSIPVSGGGNLQAEKNYVITDSETYTLPAVTGLIDGARVRLTWPRGEVPTIQVAGGATEIMLTDGTTDTFLICDAVTLIDLYYTVSIDTWEVR